MIAAGRRVDWPALALDLEAVLVTALDLRPVAVDPRVARREGRWKQAPATIETRAWSGARVAFCRVARIVSADVAIGNVLCVPAPSLRRDGRSLPILGADLVAIGARDAVVVADLSPTSAGVDDSDVLARALAADPAVALLPRLDELPAWARESFSGAALTVRANVEQEEVAALAVRRIVDAFIALVGEARPDDDTNADARAGAVRHRQRRYMERHRTEDNGLALLGRIFGNEWSADYIGQLLFPDLPEHL